MLRNFALRSVDEHAAVEVVDLPTEFFGMGITAGRRNKPVLVAGTVAAQHEQVSDAKEREVEEFVFYFRAVESAANDVGHGGHAIAPHEGGGNGYRSGTAPHAHPLVTSVGEFAKDVLVAMGGDVDISGVERHEPVYGAVHALYAFAAKRGKHFEGERGGFIGVKSHVL